MILVPEVEITGCLKVTIFRSDPQGCFRLVKTQVEVEMEVDQSAEDLEVEDFLPQEPIITIEEEEEVVLFWETSSKSKGPNQMARINKFLIKKCCSQ